MKLAVHCDHLLKFLFLGSSAVANLENKLFKIVVTSLTICLLFLTLWQNSKNILTCWHYFWMFKVAQNLRQKKKPKPKPFNFVGKRNFSCKLPECKTNSDRSLTCSHTLHGSLSPRREGLAPQSGIQGPAACLHAPTLCPGCSLCQDACLPTPTHPSRPN